jgi:hypothetical protein
MFASTEKSSGNPRYFHGTSELTDQDRYIKEIWTLRLSLEHPDSCRFGLKMLWGGGETTWYKVSAEPRTRGA